MKVTQFHFTSWPDHGVPEYAGPILNYLCRMKAQMKLSRGPTLVHCRSARVGNCVLVRVSALKMCVCVWEGGGGLEDRNERFSLPAVLVWGGQAH